MRWHRHFLQLALDHARMSKDPTTKVGAIIVGPHRELRSAGFNGFPRDIADTPERLSDRDLKLKLIVHAEMNAVVAAARFGVSLQGCTLYVDATTRDGKPSWGGPPCIRCTMHIIQSGITTIVSRPQEHLPPRWAEDSALTRELIAEANIAFVEIPHD